MLQVSRNALREAVRQLETMGIVTVRHGDGTASITLIEWTYI
jgi:DNA-binding FadR family transcriptional regulator